MSLEQQAGWRSLGPTKDSTWTKFVPDTGESSPEKRATQRRENEARRAALAAAEAQQAAEAMSAVERDRYYQRLLSQLSLHPDDRADLVEQRGFTAERVKAVGFKSVEQWQRLDFALPSTLPGVTVDGQSLNVAAAGYLCPMRNAAGLIVGMQLRVRGAEDNKYRWLTSRTSKRPNGQQPKTAEYRENPLSVFRGGDGIALVEGTGPKPALAATRLGTNVIGAAGGQWCASPKTLRDAIAPLGNPQTITLYLDAGDTGKPQVMRRWHRTIEMLQSWGHEVRCWVPQGDRDIDELTDYSSLELAPAAIVLEIGRSTQPAQGFGAGLGRQRRSNGDRRVSWQDWDISQTIGGAVANLCANAIKPFKGFGEAPKQPRSNTPDITFAAGERVSVVESAVRRGWTYILDTSGTGGRKSTEAAMLDVARLEIDKLILLSEHPRNLTTPEAAERFTPVPVRFDRMVHDGTDPLGRPVARWPKPGEVADVEGNCFQAPMFHVLASKGIEGIQASGNPICNGCPMFGKCANHQGYLKEKAAIAKTTYISAHAQSLSGPAGFDYSRAGMVWDETGKILQVTKEMSVSLHDFDQTMAVLEREHPEIHAALRPLRTAIRPLMEGAAEVPRYGHSTQALLEQLGEMPTAIAELIPDVERVYAELDDLGFLEERDGVSTTEETKAIASVRGKLQRRQRNALDAAEHLSALETIQCELAAEHGHLWEMTTYGQQLQAEAEAYRCGLAELEPEVDDLQRELKALERERAVIRRASRAVERNDRAENRQRLALAVEKRWLAPFLHCWQRQYGDANRASFHISPAFTNERGDISPGRLTICQYQRRYSNIAKAAKFNLFLDATLTRERLAQMLDIDPSSILVIQQEGTDLESQYRELEVVQIADLGKLGKHRRDGLTKRVAALQAHLEHEHFDLAVIDHMAMQPDFWWFNHSRGTNVLRDRSALLSIGTPCENIGALERKYIALTGLVPADEQDAGFMAYVDECVDNEFIQCAGRLRAILRPGQALTYYVASNHALPSEMGARVVRARELTIEAGTPAERQWAAISRHLLDCWNDGGALPTQADVAGAVGIVQGQISKLAGRFAGGWKGLRKIFQTLLEATTTDGIFFELEKNIAELAIEATQILEDHALDPPPKMLEVVVDLVDILGMDGWRQAIANLDPGIRAMLLKNLLNPPAIAPA